MSDPNEAGPSNTSSDSLGSMPMDISSDSLLAPPPPAPAAQAQPPPPPAPSSSRRKSTASTASHPPPKSPSAPAPTDLPPQPIPEPAPDYGRRYTMLLQALEVAVRKGVNKFTYKDFAAAFPLQAAIDEAQCMDVSVSVGEQLRKRIVEVATLKLEEVRTQQGLAAVQQAVLKAKERAAQGDNSIRGDEWILTPNLSPAAITATYNLPLYDEEHARLTAELEELSTSISTLSSTLTTTERARSDLEASTAQQLKEIEETVKVLEGLPVDEMTRWLEEVVREGGR